MTLRRFAWPTVAARTGSGIPSAAARVANVWARHQPAEPFAVSRGLSRPSQYSPHWYISPLRRNCFTTRTSGSERLKSKSCNFSRSLIDAQNDLPKLLHSFFHEWLVEQRNASHRTLLAYRDAWRLFLRFVAKNRTKPVAALNLEHLTGTEVLAFLQHLGGHLKPANGGTGRVFQLWGPCENLRRPNDKRKGRFSVMQELCGRPQEAGRAGAILNAGQPSRWARSCENRKR
jgi:hypothetical protein